MAEAVQDAPARRRQQARIDPVVLRQHGEAIRFHDLQVIHSRRQRGEHQPLPARQQSGPAREELGAILVLAHPTPRDRPRQAGRKTARCALARTQPRLG